MVGFDTHEKTERQLRMPGVLLADDHEVVRSGLRNVLATTELKVIAEATTGNDAVRLAKMHNRNGVAAGILDFLGLSSHNEKKWARLSLQPVIQLIFEG